MPNQTDRHYEVVNDFELRTGVFYNPNEYLDGVKFEIRIVHEDPDLIESLHDKIKELLNT